MAVYAINEVISSGVGGGVNGTGRRIPLHVFQVRDETGRLMKEFRGEGIGIVWARKKAEQFVVKLQEGRQ